MKPVPDLVYGPHLIEEAVFLAQRKNEVAAEFQSQRDRIYEIADTGERDRQFNELNRSWFFRLELGSIIEQSLREQPLIGAYVERAIIAGATRAADEGTELFVAPDGAGNGRGRDTLRLLLRPESLLDSETLQQFLRHELFHISDMLSPEFAYEPTLPKTAGGATYESVITQRYRVLWDATIDGRMVRRGWLPASARAYRRLEFHQAFPMLHELAEQSFERLFDAEQPKHSELASFALDPRGAAGQHSRSTLAGTFCALCKFPTHVFEPAPDSLGEDVLALIAIDYPRWTVAQGLCAQCADLYRGRQISLAALKTLPGWNSTA